MVLFVLPAVVGIIPIFFVVCIGIYQIIAYRNNKFNINRLSKLQRYINIILNISLLFFIALIFFMRNHEQRIFMGMIGMNVWLIILFTAIIPAILLAITSVDYSDISYDGKECKEIDVKVRTNRKKAMCILLGTILLIRSTVTTYVVDSSSLKIKIVLIFLGLSLSQYYYLNNNIHMQTKRSVKIKLLIKNILVIALIILLNYTTGTDMKLSVDIEGLNNLRYWQPMNGDISCDHKPHNDIEELVGCMHVNGFVDIEKDNIKVFKTKTMVKRGNTKIKIVELKSSKEAEEYCKENYPKYRSFFIGNHAVLEIANKDSEINFDYMAKVYLGNY